MPPPPKFPKEAPDGNPAPPDSALRIPHSALRLPHPWSDPFLPEPMARELLTRPHHYLWVAGDDGSHGHLMAQLTPDAPGDILTLYVPPEHRRKGIGKNLLQTALQHAETSRIPTISIEVRSGNISALTLYKSMGFRQIGTRVAYYKQPTEDAIVLTVEIG